jgi:hypothetical protein
MLVKAVLRRDASKKFGIFICKNRDDKPSIEKVVYLNVDDSRQLLQPGDVLVRVNGIDCSRVMSIIGVKASVRMRTRVEGRLWSRG